MAERMEAHAASDLPKVRLIGFHDLTWALRAGWADFRAAPGRGIALAAIYVLAGIVLVSGLTLAGHGWIALFAAAGFPLLGPVAASGFYEASRQREAGRVMPLSALLRRMLTPGSGTIATMGILIALAFVLWLLAADVVLTAFLGEAPPEAMAATLASPLGGIAIIAELIVGAVFAVLLFSVTVVSLPLLMDRDVDLFTAMTASLGVCVANPETMLVWGAICAGMLFVAMVPGFLGLLLVLPWLGHASWHLYRRVIEPVGVPVRTAPARTSDVRG